MAKTLITPLAEFEKAETKARKKHARDQGRLREHIERLRLWFEGAAARIDPISSIECECDEAELAYELMRNNHTIEVQVLNLRLTAWEAGVQFDRPIGQFVAEVLDADAAGRTQLEAVRKKWHVAVEQKNSAWKQRRETSSLSSP